MSRYEKTLTSEQVVGRLKEVCEDLAKREGWEKFEVKTCFGFDQMCPGFFAQVWVESIDDVEEIRDEVYLPGLDGMTIGEGAGRTIERLERFSLAPLFQQLYPEGWSAMCADLPF